MNSKYQEALKELKEFVHSELDGTRMLDEYLKHCDTLQELVDKEQDYTLEEVKKMWEEEGWKASEDGYFGTITFITDEKGIYFDIKDKTYFTFQKELEHNSFDIDCKLHELITKTLKALEKEKD